MPGPLLTATISESSQRGFITGPLMIAGHAILELVLVIALLLGLAPFFQQPVVFVATALIPSSWFLSKKRVVFAVSKNVYLNILAC